MYSSRFPKIYRKIPALESSFYNCWRTCKFIKKEIPTQVFSCEFFEIFENTFYQPPLRDCLWSSRLQLLVHTSTAVLRQSCINVLLTKVYKYLNGCSPDLINKSFIYTKTTTTYAIWMSFPLINGVTNTY